MPAASASAAASAITVGSATSHTVVQTLDTMARITGWLAMPFIFYGLMTLLFIIVICAMEALEDDKDHYDYSGSWFWATAASVGVIALCLHTWDLSVGFTLFGVTFSALVVCIIAYPILGAMWSLTRWFFKLYGIKETYLEIKNKFRADNNLPADFLKPVVASIPIFVKDDDSDEPEDSDATKVFRPNREEKEQRALNMRFYSTVAGAMRVYDKPGYISNADREVREQNEARDNPALIMKAIRPIAARHKARIMQWVAFWPISIVWFIINNPVRRIYNLIWSFLKGTYQRMSDSMFAEA